MVRGNGRGNALVVRRYLVLMFLGALSGHGCTRAQPEQGAREIVLGTSLPVPVRESAGIQIVESTAPVCEEGAGWRVVPKPILTIGVLDGPEKYQLFRAISGLRTSRGEIVVANAGSLELRFYDLEGTYLRAAGREGGGPGEFADMGEIWRFGPDSLVRSDFGNNRLSVHGIDGSFGRTMRLEHVVAATLPMGVFADGSVLAYWFPISSGATADGLQRVPRMYGIWDAEGAFVDFLARLPGSES